VIAMRIGPGSGLVWRSAVRRLSYCITSNHVHLLLRAE
jgi:hypothetical protein